MNRPAATLLIAVLGFPAGPAAALVFTPTEEARQISDPVPPAATAEPVVGGEGENSPPQEMVFAPSDLWQRIRDGFAIPDLEGPLVRKQEEWYAQRPDYVKRMVERSRRYLYYVAEEVQRRNMPMEIALLPMIESAYNPRAYSRSHASGMWQFIPSTGKLYGLPQNWWYDGRRDVLAATTAALDYLQYLHGLFGDWRLALASYNWGEGAVSRAIARNQAKGLPTDYSSLPMPAETREYVPKLQAVKNIIMSPSAYGLALAEIPNQPYFVSVPAHKSMDLTLAARLAEIPLEEFVSLNPAHNRPVVHKDTTAAVLPPVQQAKKFEENLEKHDKPLTSWQAYTLKAKERLDKVAARFGLTLAKLKEINGVVGRWQVVSGMTLLVPTPGSALAAEIPAAVAALVPTVPAARSARRAASAPKVVTHVVRKGDTLFNIAKRYAVTVAELVGWNRLRANHLALGQKLIIKPDA